MNSGRLRHRIKIQKYALNIDEYGENQPIWSDFAELWADVKSETGEETEDRTKMRGEITYSIKIRFIKNLTPDMKILWNGKSLEIDAILADRTNAKFQIIKCREITE
jgi:SPP1 family predicted phage head-tail adaptor